MKVHPKERYVEAVSSLDVELARLGCLWHTLLSNVAVPYPAAPDTHHNGPETRGPPPLAVTSAYPATSGSIGRVGPSRGVTPPYPASSSRPPSPSHQLTLPLPGHPPRDRRTTGTSGPVRRPRGLPCCGAGPGVPGPNFGGSMPRNLGGSTPGIPGLPGGVRGPNFGGFPGARPAVTSTYPAAPFHAVSPSPGVTSAYPAATLARGGFEPRNFGGSSGGSGAKTSGAFRGSRPQTFGGPGAAPGRPRGLPCRLCTSQSY